jgi:hypothetical protein
VVVVVVATASLGPVEVAEMAVVALAVLLLAGVLDWAHPQPPTRVVAVVAGLAGLLEARLVAPAAPASSSSVMPLHS